MTRLARLSLEGLSDDDLISAYYRAAAFAVRPALRKFAQAIIDRPSLADSDEQLHAYATLARTEEDVVAGVGVRRSRPPRGGRKKAVARLVGPDGTLVPLRRPRRPRKRCG